MASSESLERQTKALNAFGLVIQTDDGQAEAGSDCEVFPDNVPAFQLFMSCARHLTMVTSLGGTRWRAAPPSEVRQVMQWQGAKPGQRGELWQQYQVMEIEALRILNEREAAAARKAK
ncbi:DUF1799 domain-containing protein [Malikia spinosa]|uniref:DUF1799 domain-containing protein n=1 Tax=Malikia spinosa TaxID=86180 RepID=UPI001474BE23|nr:DUF1799 domain-containing protein [Malikia spinosa]